MAIPKDLKLVLWRVGLGSLGSLANITFAASPDIEEIIVVAQKRPQPLQEIPASVSALNDELIQVAGIRDIFDVAEQVPSLDVRQNTGPINTGFRIRRIGNEPNIPNFEPAVGLFVDGAFRTRSGVAVGGLFDIERIEVLRGPQSTLYGKNTTAGVIHFITKKPTEHFEAYGEVIAGNMEGFESAGMMRLEAALSGPLSDTLQARLSGTFFDHDHLAANLLTGDDTEDMRRHSIRAQFLYTPTPALEARLIFGRFDVNSANSGDVDIDPGIAIAAINSAFGVPCPSPLAGDRALCRNRAGVADLEANDAILNLTLDWNGYTLTSISGYEDYQWMRDFDADQLNIHLVDLIDQQESESYSQELRLASPPDGTILDWMAGAFYYRNEFLAGGRDQPTAVLGPAAPLLELAPGIPFGQPGDSGFQYSESDTTHFSLFGNIVCHLTDEFDLTAGVRWQTERKRTTIDNSADHTNPTLITLALFPSTANAILARDGEGYSWNLIGRYRWIEKLMTYMSVSRGFKSGGFNGRFGNVRPENRAYDDETVLSIEAGVKTMLARDRVRLNASVFSAEYKDYQSAGFVSLQYLVNNAEEVDVSGVEVDLQAALSEDLSGGLAVSFADAGYGEYTGGACHFGRRPDNAAGTACELTGENLPLAPEWIVSGNLDYEHPTKRGTLFVHIDGQWMDGYFANANLDPRHVQDSFSVINLRSGLRYGPYEITAWIRNAGDTTYIMQAGPSNLFGGDPAFGLFLGSPRTYGLTFRAHW